MADVTLDAFKTVDNPTKAMYPDYFKGLWSNYRYSSDMGKEAIEKTKEGLKYLRSTLSNLIGEYADLPFKRRFTEAFINVIDVLLNDKESEVPIDGTS